LISAEDGPFGPGLRLTIYLWKFRRVDLATPIAAPEILLGDILLDIELIELMLFAAQFFAAGYFEAGSAVSKF